MVASLKVKVLTRSYVSQSVKMKLSPMVNSEDFVRIFQYYNDVFVTLDSPFISLSHLHLKEHFPLDHLAKIWNIAEHFYKIEPEIIYCIYIYMYIIQWIRLMAVAHLKMLFLFFYHNYTNGIHKKLFRK